MIIGLNLKEKLSYTKLPFNHFIKITFCICWVFWDQFIQECRAAVRKEFFSTVLNSFDLHSQHINLEGLDICHKIYQQVEQFWLQLHKIVDLYKQLKYLKFSWGYTPSLPRYIYCQLTEVKKISQFNWAHFLLNISRRRVVNYLNLHQL